MKNNLGRGLAADWLIRAIRGSELYPFRTDSFAILFLLPELPRKEISMKRPPKSAGKLVVFENSDPIQAETAEVQNRIRERAYELSQTRGHAGRQVEDWLSAESEIISVPPAEMIERNGEYQVQLAVAGIDPDDVNVMASTDQVLVKCECRHDHGPDLGIVHFCDFKSATVFRSLYFPEPVDLASLKVQFDGGMLQITAAKEGAVPAPKRQPRKPAARKSAKGTLGAA
jgi:HSP20 family molecular chaperone IbpA